VVAVLFLRLLVFAVVGGSVRWCSCGVVVLLSLLLLVPCVVWLIACACDCVLMCVVCACVCLLLLHVGCVVCVVASAVCAVVLCC